MILVYVVIAVLLLSVFNGVSYYVVDFLRNYMILKKMGVRVPIKPIVIYLFTAFVLFNLFYILVLVYTFLQLE